METVYINNLNEKINVERLKTELTELCSQFGRVETVMARRSLRMRGQAFVVFSTAETASAAIEGLQNHILHGKPIRVALARSKSDCKISENELSQRKEQRTGDRPATLEVDRGDPHNLLFIENITPEVSSESLSSICEPMPGFVEARMFAVRHLAFIEFTDAESATAAIASLDKLGKVTYAKK